MAGKLIILATALCLVAVLAQSNGKSAEEIATEKKRTDFEEQCKKHGGNFESAFNAPKAFMECIKFTEMEAVLKEVPKNNTSIKKLFDTYCDQNNLKKCMKGFTYETQDCYADRILVKKLNDEIYGKLVDFVCDVEERKKVESFFSGGGFDCSQNRSEQLKQCWDGTLGSDPNVTDVVHNLHLSFNEKQCNQTSELQKCVLKELKTCSGVDVIESIFNHLMKVVPCKTFPKPEDTVDILVKKDTTSKNTTNLSKESSTKQQNAATDKKNATNSKSQSPSAQKGKASGLHVMSATIIMAALAAIVAIH